MYSASPSKWKIEFCGFQFSVRHQRVNCMKRLSCRRIATVDFIVKEFFVPQSARAARFIKDVRAKIFYSIDFFLTSTTVR